MISIVSGFLFNINPYIPMTICMIICFINILLTFYIYEVPIIEEKQEKENKKIQFNKAIILMFVLYGAFYSMIAVSQNNSKLFIQLDLENILSIDKVAIYISLFIFISRIARLLSNLIFIKAYNKFKKKMLFILETFLVLSFTCLLIGHFISNIIGIWIMALGFFIYLFIRDPFDNYMRKMLFKNSSEKIHDKIINYLSLSRKIFTLIYSLIISSMLVSLNYVHVMALLLLLSISFIILIVKIYNLVIK